MNLLDWLLVVLVAGLRRLRLLAGLHLRRVRDDGAARGWPLRRLRRPQALGDADPSVWVSLGALFIVLLCASFGQAVLQYAGGRLRDQIPWQPVRSLDAVGGGALSVVAVLSSPGHSVLR